MKITTSEITDKKVWEEFLKDHPEANFLQSWYWGEFHEKLHHRVIRTGFYDDTRLIGVMLSIVERARRGTYLTIPGGPILDWSTQSAVLVFKREVNLLAKRNACVFVRIRPQLEKNNFSTQLFKKLGFRNAPMHLHAQLTNQLDITRPEEELLAGMRKATRYEIRKGQKEGIEVKESVSEKDIKKFYELQVITSKRQGFIPFSYKFLYEQFKVFSESQHAVLYSAYLGKKLLAQAFIIFYGSEAVYHYGASTEEGRKFPGAYLIQWQAILEAKRRGMKTYNFWGVANNTSHRFYNLSMFKRGFGGEDFEYLEAQDLVINWPKYLINFVVEHARKKMRRV